MPRYEERNEGRLKSDVDRKRTAEEDQERILDGKALNYKILVVMDSGSSMYFAGQARPLRYPHTQRFGLQRYEAPKTTLIGEVDPQSVPRLTDQKT